RGRGGAGDVDAAGYTVCRCRSGLAVDKRSVAVDQHAAGDCAVIADAPGSAHIDAVQRARNPGARIIHDIAAAAQVDAVPGCCRNRTAVRHRTQAADLDAEPAALDVAAAARSAAVDDASRAERYAAGYRAVIG